MNPEFGTIRQNFGKVSAKFRANRMHVVHVVYVHECARGQIWAILSTYIRLKICMIVVLGEDNILTKFRANPMYLMHVVRARMCTSASGQI